MLFPPTCTHGVLSNQPSQPSLNNLQVEYKKGT